MNSLLMDDYPLLVLPKLAEKIGLNEAIMLQQVHFWLQRSNNFKESKKWVYNTYEGWSYQFPFWSRSTIRRTINSLEKQNMLITGNFNTLKIDNTKWYTVNYEELDRVSRPPVQNEQTNWSKWTSPPAQNEQAITIDYPEITTETIPYVEIINYLNGVAGKNYRSSTRKTKELIKARWNEGFGIDDFKKVINIKNDEWKNDEKMSKFIRPNTLFGTKFEDYLNQNDESVPDDDGYDYGF